MFSNFDMSKMAEVMSQMQEKAKELQEQEKSIELTARAGGGMVEIRANGMGEIIDLNIDNSLLEDKESLQILLISAMNDINKMVEDNRKSQAMGMFGGINPFGP
ncbi:MAG: YbaB/EbfC family nucleoid-associated protein [Sulfurovum sp.]|nr:YbaB/EbfC family nucleoid-associated protein [Sulfurovum sp.]MCB4744900.1 YbaB/EbfC family nucleoid-associated protein [Sulfurovum sp.]MCB4746097.1 YbaB/EbfC family nucleoid-associated protein [Sulfurovum sp.]MCB4748248.1 YbaB/EbfC family nucleoid-associated protein [Sulfurovum sp.]MCB4749615.1 YbaB/EbfC family nucleoid-associated protein [Sulfurovum sp.]